MRTKREAPPAAAVRRRPARPASARATVLAALAALLGGLTLAVALPVASGANPVTPGAPVCAVDASAGPPAPTGTGAPPCGPALPHPATLPMPSPATPQLPNPAPHPRGNRPPV